MERQLQSMPSENTWLNPTNSGPRLEAAEETSRTGDCPGPSSHISGEHQDLMLLPSYRYRLPYARSIPLAGRDASLAHAKSLGAKPGPLGMGVTVSVTYVSRERYVCLTGENLAGWKIAQKIFAFFAPPPPERIRISGWRGDGLFAKSDFKSIFATDSRQQ